MLFNQTQRSWEKREWSTSVKSVDCCTNSPYEYHRKCKERSLGNVYADTVLEKTDHLQYFAPCKVIQDSLGFWSPGTAWIADSLSVGLGFWIPIVSEIPKSLSWVPSSKAHDSGFNKQPRIPGRNNQTVCLYFLKHAVYQLWLNNTVFTRVMEVSSTF